MKQKVENMKFAPQEPVDTLVTEIKDLADIAEIAGSLIIDHQRVNVGYIALQQCRQYKTGLKEWNDLPQQDCTWNNFKRISVMYRSHYAKQEIWPSTRDSIKPRL